MRRLEAIWRPMQANRLVAQAIRHAGGKSRLWLRNPAARAGPDGEGQRPGNRWGTAPTRPAAS